MSGEPILEFGKYLGEVWKHPPVNYGCMDACYAKFSFLAHSHDRRRDPIGLLVYRNLLERAPLDVYGGPPWARYLFKDDAFIGTEIGAADLLKERNVGPKYVPEVCPCLRMILAVLSVPQIPGQDPHATSELV